MSLNLPPDLSAKETPRCPHFGPCGGCSLQNVCYEDQIRGKQLALRELLSCNVPVIPSPQPYNYRFKMACVAAFGKLGFRMRGTHKQVVDLHECHVVSPRVSALLSRLHTWIDEYNIEGYDYLRFCGDLRYIVTRHAFSSDQLMVTVTTAAKDTAAGPLLDRLRDCAESVVWMVNPTPTDVPEGKIEKIHGPGHIRQRIGNCDFILGPYSFFQNNLLLVDEMFNEITRHTRGYVMDLYCGVGTIGISCAAR